MSDSDEGLLADLQAAEEVNPHLDRCKACETLNDVSESVRPELAKAMNGTIGVEKLSRILANRGYPIGRRAIERHRQEGHTP